MFTTSELRWHSLLFEYCPKYSSSPKLCCFLQRLHPYSFHILPKIFAHCSQGSLFIFLAMFWWYFSVSISPIVCFLYYSTYCYCWYSVISAHPLLNSSLLCSLWSHEFKLGPSLLLIYFCYGLNFPMHLYLRLYMRFGKHLVAISNRLSDHIDVSSLAHISEILKMLYAQNYSYLLAFIVVFHCISKPI